MTKEKLYDVCVSTVEHFRVRAESPSQARMRIINNEDIAINSIVDDGVEVKTK